MHRKRRAVLAQSRHFAADADDLLFAGREVVVQVAVVPLAIGTGHQHVDVAPEHLAEAIAEQPLCRRVESLNQAAIVDHDDGVDGRFNDRAHTLFAFAERFFDLHAPAEIVKDARKRRLAVDLHLADGQMKRKRAAVLAPPTHFAAGSDDARDTGFEVVGEVPVVLLAVGAGHQDLDVLAQHFGGAIAEQPLGRWVERLDEPLGVDDDDAVHGGVEDRLEDGFHLARKLKWQALGDREMLTYLPRNPAFFGRTRSRRWEIFPLCRKIPHLQCWWSMTRR